MAWTFYRAAGINVHWTEIAPVNGPNLESEVLDIRYRTLCLERESVTAIESRTCLRGRFDARRGTVIGLPGAGWAVPGRSGS